MSKYFHDTSAQVQFLIEQLQITQTQAGLDIGFGSGVHLQGLREKGIYVEGVDIEESKIPNTLKGDVFELELEADRYDFAYCLSPYFGEKWWEIERFFAQVYKLLKNNGKFVLDLNNFRSIPEHTTIFRWNKQPEQVMVNHIQRLPDRFTGTRLLIKPNLEVEEIPLLWRIFTEEEITNLAKKYNFRISKVFGGFQEEKVDWNPNKQKTRIIVLLEKIESGSKN